MDAILDKVRAQSNKRFNPRARDGRDKYQSRRIAMTNVSIHAPVMDAI